MRGLEPYQSMEQQSRMGAPAVQQMTLNLNSIGSSQISDMDATANLRTVQDISVPSGLLSSIREHDTTLKPIEESKDGTRSEKIKTGKHPNPEE